MGWEAALGLFQRCNHHFANMCDVVVMNLLQKCTIVKVLYNNVYVDLQVFLHPLKTLL